MNHGKYSIKTEESYLVYAKREGSGSAIGGERTISTER